jgi:hypothetical protein
VETAKENAAHLLAVMATEALLGLVASHGQDDEQRIATMTLRTRNRWLLTVWQYLDDQVPAELTPRAEALYLALGFAQATTTHAWPDSPRWRERCTRRPEHWLTRAVWTLCHLLHKPDDPELTAAYRAALAEGRADPHLPGYADFLPQPT